jgi:hypothetical protein
MLAGQRALQAPEQVALGALPLGSGALAGGSLLCDQELAVCLSAAI